MPVRIYALAKELNVDSKDLVDQVKKAGITGKGSALASLSDDEVIRVREYLSGDSGGGTATKAAPKKPAAKPTVGTPVAAVRDSVVPTGKRPAAIKIGRGKNSGSVVDKSVESEPTETVEQAEPAKSTAPAPKLAPAPAAPAAPPPETTGPRPEAPLSMRGKKELKEEPTEPAKPAPAAPTSPGVCPTACESFRNRSCLP